MDGLLVKLDLQTNKNDISEGRTVYTVHLLQYPLIQELFYSFTFIDYIITLFIGMYPNNIMRATSIKLVCLCNVKVCFACCVGYSDILSKILISNST